MNDKDKVLRPAVRRSSSSRSFQARLRSAALCFQLFVQHLSTREKQMYHDFNYEATLTSSLRAQWQLDDVLREDQELDFSRNFMPESLARTAALDR